jgi:hypothetical protein
MCRQLGGKDLWNQIRLAVAESEIIEKLGQDRLAERHALVRLGIQVGELLDQADIARDARDDA